MLEHRVHLRVEDWDDVAFREAVDAAWARVRLGPEAIDSTTAAAHLQLLLRGAGYPHASVEIHKTVDEALDHFAHFEVSRDVHVTALGRPA
jgi:hypothetical protein